MSAAVTYRPTAELYKILLLTKGTGRFYYGTQYLLPG